MLSSRISVFAIALTLVATLATSAPVAAADGRKPFIWPTRGRVTQPFGCTGYFAEPRYGNCRLPECNAQIFVCPACRETLGLFCGAECRKTFEKAPRS